MLLKDMPPKLRSFIIRTVRQWFVTTKKYSRVKHQARVETPRYKKDGTLSKVKNVNYKCKKCKELFKEVHVDHIFPVVALYDSTSTMTLSQYIKKVDCEEGNLQVLCKACHDVKTKEENKKRRNTKKNTNRNTGKLLKPKKKAIKKPRKVKI